MVKMNQLKWTVKIYSQLLEFLQSTFQSYIILTLKLTNFEMSTVKIQKATVNFYS